MPKKFIIKPGFQNQTKRRDVLINMINILVVVVQGIVGIKFKTVVIHRGYSCW